MPIDPGKLDRKITIQQRTTTRETDGSVAVAYSTFKTVNAQKVQTGGGEARRAGAVRADTTLILRIRYIAALTTQHRVLFESKHYDITEISEEGRREFQLIQSRSVEGYTE
jgi:SPP1 family predicted phage head-tail adaptor